MIDNFDLIQAKESDRKSPDTLWGVLSQGLSVGSREPILISNVKDVENLSVTEILRIGGPDKAAMALSISISPPQFQPEANLPGFPNINIQGVSSFNEIDLASGNFVFGDLTALVEWGVGGIQNMVEVDIANGIHLCLSASFVRMRAKAVQIVGGANSGGVLNIGAFVSPGFDRSIALPTLTKNFPNGLGIAAVTPAIAIPRYARIVNMTCLCNSLQFRFWRDAARTQSVSVFTCVSLAGTNQPGQIPNGAYFMDVNNASGAVAGPLSLIFGLAI